METIAVILGIINIILLIVLLIKQSGKKGNNISEDLRNSRMEIMSGVNSSISAVSDSLKNSSEMQSNLIKTELKGISDKEEQLRRELLELIRANQGTTKETLALYSEKLGEIKTTLETRIKSMEESNEKKLDEMRKVVDEKLQATLNDRISQSFKEVSERLAEVHKGLGEMQTLATGVGDLKKVLSNVKTRGILGEIQLGSILEDILSPEQYETNVVTVENSKDPVEFAVKLPGNGASPHVYLPVDSKFPADAYAELSDAYDSADQSRISEAKKLLIARIKAFAKDIKTKYVSPPNTTDFAIMFLPTEGLYAEVVKLGLVETLQSEYKVTVAGPTTMAALLNSLRMGFRTLAIQKRSSEIWETLSAVKTQFSTFEEVLAAAQKKLVGTSEELEKLIGTRTRQINRKLKDITEMPLSQAEAFFPTEDGFSDDEE